MGRFIYAMRRRPFGLGCQPKGHIDWADADKEKDGYWSTVTYDHKLTVDEEYDYELELIKEEAK
jgi:hypothetical protein